MNAPLSGGIHDVIQKWTSRGYIVPDVTEQIEADLFGVALEIGSQENGVLETKLESAKAASTQYGEQLEAVGEELDRWKNEVRLIGKNREHAERLEDILEGERS